MRSVFLLCLALTLSSSRAETGAGCEFALKSSSWQRFLGAFGLNFTTNPAAMSAARWSSWQQAEFMRRMPLTAGSQNYLILAPRPTWAETRPLHNDKPLFTAFSAVELVPAAGASDSEVVNLLEWYRKQGVRHFVRGYFYTTRKVEGALDGRAELNDVTVSQGLVQIVDKGSHALCRDTLFLPGSALESDAKLAAYLSRLKNELTFENSSRLKFFRPATADILERAFAEFGARAQAFANPEFRGLAHDGGVIEVRNEGGWRESAVAVHEVAHVQHEFLLVEEQNLANVARMISFDVLEPKARGYADGFRFDEVEAFGKHAEYVAGHHSAEAIATLDLALSFVPAQEKLLDEARALLERGPVKFEKVTKAGRLDRVRIKLAQSTLTIALPRAGLGAYQNDMNAYLHAVFLERRRGLRRLADAYAEGARIIALRVPQLAEP